MLFWEVDTQLRRRTSLTVQQMFPCSLLIFPTLSNFFLYFWDFYFWYNADSDFHPWCWLFLLISGINSDVLCARLDDLGSSSAELRMKIARMHRARASHKMTTTIREWDKRKNWITYSQNINKQSHLVEQRALKIIISYPATREGREGKEGNEILLFTCIWKHILYLYILLRCGRRTTSQRFTKTVVFLCLDGRNLIKLLFFLLISSTYILLARRLFGWHSLNSIWIFMSFDIFQRKSISA